MFFKIAFRNLWKRKVFTIINIFGLSLGLSACLAIYLFISDELDYDNFYPDSDRLVRIVRENGEGGEKTASAVINYKLGELARTNLAQIKGLSQLSNALEVKVQHGDDVQTERVYYTDREFFRLFGIQFVNGSQETVFQNPYEAVLTTETAVRIFGDKEAVGKSIDIDGRMYRVVGVVKGMPKNSHLHFNYLLSIQTTKSFYSEQMFDHWGNIWIYTYALLNEGVNIDLFDRQIADMVETHGPAILKDFGVRFYSQPVESIHLHSHLDGELEKNGDIQLLRILGAVALLILIIACFNFINLTTARSAWRSKEVGVKKVLGIKKPELIRQFLWESILTTLLAFGFSLMLVLISLPLFNQLAGKQISTLDVFAITPLLLTIVVFVGVISGIIPALFLSSFKPIRVLKGQSHGDSAIAKKLRHILIVLQFSIAIALIIGTMVIFDQLHFIKTRELGVNIDDVVVLRLKDKSSKASGEVLLNALKQSSSVLEVSLASDIPFESLNSWRVRPKGENTTDQLINVVSIDANYVRTLEIDITDYTPTSIYSWNQERSVIVNESFVNHFLITEPIGSEILINHLEQPVRIAGVVKDYHFASLHEGIRPLLFYAEPSWYARVVIRTNGDASLEHIQGVWNSINKDSEFDYFILKDRFDNLYTTEEKTGNLVAYFSFFSLLIASMGLYGLAAYVAESKLKEISVRKILGASLGSLVRLQFNVFVKLILYSALLSVPFSIWTMGSWLDGFAYNVGVSWVIVLSAIIAVLIFTIISVGYRSLVAAIANPVDNLRSD